jgi:hypothetical protein
MVQLSKLFILGAFALFSVVGFADEEESLPMAPQSYDELGGQPQHVFAPVGGQKYVAPSVAPAQVSKPAPAAPRMAADKNKPAAKGKVAAKTAKPPKAGKLAKKPAASAPKMAAKAKRGTGKSLNKGASKAPKVAAKATNPGKSSVKSKQTPKRGVASKPAPSKAKKSKKAK